MPFKARRKLFFFSISHFLENTTEKSEPRFLFSGKIINEKLPSALRREKFPSFIPFAIAFWNFPYIQQKKRQIFFRLRAFVGSWSMTAVLFWMIAGGRRRSFPSAVFPYLPLISIIKGGWPANGGSCSPFILAVGWSTGFAVYSLIEILKSEFYLKSRIVLFFLSC